MPPTPSDTVIFGLGPQSSLAWHCLAHDSPLRPVAFAVDRDRIDRETHHGLPVTAFEDLRESFPPEETALLVPIAYRHVNRARAALFERGRSMGYRLQRYVSSRAFVWDRDALGENVLVYEHASVEPFAEIGDDVILRSGAVVSHHAVIEAHAFVAIGAVIGGGARVGERSFVGLNATVLDEVVVAPGCVIGAGAVVTRDTEPDGVYTGSPAVRRKVPPQRALA